MRYEYTGRHLEVTPALRSHVENHFDRIKHLFNNESTKAQIIIEVEKGKHRSEVVVKWRDQILTAASKQSDMYQSLTQTIDKIEKQALKLKNKVTDKKHQKAKNIDKYAVATEGVKPDTKSPKIVNIRNHTVKPMTTDEALLKLDGDENQFVVFRDAVNQKISVLYKRKDGNYGLIQP